MRATLRQITSNVASAHVEPAAHEPSCQACSVFHATALVSHLFTYLVPYLFLYSFAPVFIPFFTFISSQPSHKPLHTYLVPGTSSTHVSCNLWETCMCGQLVHH